MGIDVATYNASRHEFQRSYKLAFAASVSGLKASGVHIIRVREKTRRRLSIAPLSPSSSSFYCSAFCTSQCSILYSTTTTYQENDNNDYLNKGNDVEKELELVRQLAGTSSGIDVETLVVAVIEESQFSDGASLFADLTSKITAATTASSDSNTVSEFATQLQSISSSSSPTLAAALSSVTTQTASVPTTFDTVILNSQRPTSSPTSMPTCGSGSFGEPNRCSPCLPGTYSSAHDELSCTLCELGKYSDIQGSKECFVCPYPLSSVKLGSTECSAFAIQFSFEGIASILSGLVALFLFSLSFAKSQQVPAFVVMAFPTLDILTDLAYIATTTFVSPMLYSISVFFFILPNSIFVLKLYERGAYPSLIIPFPGTQMFPKVIWLSSNRGYPLVNEERLSYSFEKHDSIPKLISYWVLWIFLVAGQFAYLIAYVFWFGINIPLLLPWFILGIFLFQSKVWSIGPVWNFWVTRWTGSDRFNQPDKVIIDTGLLNESLFSEFLMETLPQLIIQSFNNQLTNLWTPIGYFSAALSVAIALNGM